MSIWQSAGFEKHYAALTLEITEDTPRAIKGPSADAAMSAASDNKDIGLWNLSGTSVEIVGAIGKLTVDDSEVDVTKKPGKQAESVRWLPNVNFLCESDKLNPVCPTAAVVGIPAGHITAAGGAFARKLEFLNDGVKVGPDRFCVARFRAVIPFAEELAVRLSRERVLRFSDSMTIGISNTCVCGLGVAPAANHFYGHYDVVQAKRRPIAQRAGPKPALVWWPEICNPAIVEG